MVTLIAVYNSDGCVGRCDAKCYNAQHADCDCICGGSNHGVGKERAIDNSHDHWEEMLEKYQEDHQFTEAEVPILYEVKTATARRIARLINAAYGGQPVVKNVERTDRLIGKGKDWLITLEPKKRGDFYHDHQVLVFSSVKEVRDYLELNPVSEEFLPLPIKPASQGQQTTFDL